MIAVYSTILALVISIALVPLFARYADALGLLDRPGTRKIHSNPIPRVGGIAIAVGTLVSILVWLPFRGEIVGYILGVSVIFIGGLADDRLDLDYRIKFFCQILGAVVFIYAGDIQLTRVPFFPGVTMPGWLGVPLTVVVLIAITNAINLSDGMDGLAGGTSMLVAGVFGYMAYAAGDAVLALVALSLMGATLGFLRYNTFPARVFMGDSGSQFLGFSVAVLGIVLIERSNTMLSPLVPLLALALPIIDTLQVMVRRILAGMSPFSPDRRHLHHRLLDIGFSQHGAVFLIYLIQCALVLLAWWLRFAADYVVLGAILLFAATLLFGLRAWERHHAAAVRPPRPPRIEPLIKFLRENSVLYQVGRQGVIYGVSLLFLFVAVFSDKITGDVGWLSLLVFIMLLFGFAPNLVPLTFPVGRLATFTTAVLTVYLAETQGVGGPDGVAWLHGYMLFLLVCVALWLRFGGSRDFQLNTLDLLIAVIVAIVPNMPVVKTSGVAPMILESLLLFYACELVFNNVQRKWHLLRVSTLATLAILAVRSLL